MTRHAVPLLLAALLAALLAGCATARDVAAAYQQAAQRNEERGIPVTSPAPSQDIPTGLVGDTRNASHAGPPVTPQ